MLAYETCVMHFFNSCSEGGEKIIREMTQVVFRHDLWVKNPENWLQILQRVWLSHMHNSKKSSALFSGVVEKPGAAGRGRRWRINSAG